MKTILFVCVENSCRSQMAEAFGHMLGQGVLDVYSSGSAPSGQVNPKAISSLAELDYDLSRHVSKPLSDIPQIEYAMAITLGCGDECPNVRATHREDWKIPDPKHLDSRAFNQVRDLIRDRVADLLVRLA